VEEMIEIFRQYYDKTKSGYFLVLTPNVNFIQERIPQELKRIIIAKQINYQDVPAYLSAADIAFSLRIPRYSMRGVFPIKLAEYLLMGLPTITSKGIGDTEDLLKDAPGCFIFNHFSRKSMILVADFVEKSETFDKNKIRDFAEKNFSIEKSAKQYIKTLDKLV
jgi:glycosyltransferase involved in cell wall biosynthesis